MPEPIIRVENLGKKYLLKHHHTGERYRTLRDVLAGGLASGFGLFNQDDAGGSSTEEFWALKDVSFEVKEGDVVGIIGRNGAGKSTLLKILSRITEPTAGRVTLNGRVASLLEVGTGFHPELTGRENVYLNGSILGMTRREITRKFDEIVAFAEVEKFLDTPVKRYSSGMYVRLAFAVAAHLEPEILVVDEVLAVGDTEFQKKCLGKMNEVADGGRTVLFVSHNMQTVFSLTKTVVLLSEGKVAFIGATPEGVARYSSESYRSGNLKTLYTARPKETGNYLATAEVVTSDAYGEHICGRPIEFRFEVEIHDPREKLCFSFQVIDDLDRPVCYLWLLDRGHEFNRGTGRYHFRCLVPRLRLYMGRYTLKTYLSDRRANEMFETLSGICHFEVSMRTITRAEYDWHPGTTVYLEDGTWTSVDKV